jgi:hypothetical protein
MQKQLNKKGVRNVAVKGTQLATFYGETLTLQSDTVVLSNPPAPTTSVQMPFMPAVIGNAAYKNSSALSPKTANSTYRGPNQPITRYLVNEMTPYFYSTQLDFTPFSILEKDTVMSINVPDLKEHSEITKDTEFDIILNVPKQKEQRIGVFKATYIPAEGDNPERVEYHIASMNSNVTVGNVQPKVYQASKDSTDSIVLSSGNTSATLANQVLLEDPLLDENFYEHYRGAKQLASVMRSQDTNYMTINDFVVDAHSIEDIVFTYSDDVSTTPVLHIGVRVKVTGEQGEGYVSPSFVSPTGLDGAALAILMLEKAYTIANERAAFKLSMIQMLKAKIPDLMIKFPFYEEALTQFMKAMTSKKFIDTFGTAMGLTSDLYGRNVNNTNYRFKLIEPFTQSLGGAYNLEIPTIHEDGFEFNYKRLDDEEKPVTIESEDYSHMLELYL